MFEFLRAISDWTISFAEGAWAAPVLAAVAATESIFFPIPPDPLLIGVAVRQPELALWLAALTTASSVAGALVGHWLGLRFGRPLLLRLVSHQKVERVERLFQRYGTWAILLAAFTPIPYKVFTITAGVMALDRRTFTVASIIGRGARFFLLGGLIFFFGESIMAFVEDNFDLLTVAFSVALVAAAVVLAWLFRRRAKGRVQPD